MLLNVYRAKGDYTSHSFRIVAAITAATAGVPDHLVQILGRLSSDAYKLCIIGLLNRMLQPFRRDSVLFQCKPVTTERIYHSSSIPFLR